MVCRAQPSVCAALVYPLFSISPGFNLVYAQYMEGYADLPTPSMGADWSYARLRQAQGPLAVFNNRTSADNPPHPKFHNNRAYDLVIFCEAFSFVKDRNILRPLLDTQRLFRPADGVIEFLETCTRSYATEAKRAQAMRGPLSKLLRRELGIRLGMGHPWVNPHPIHGFSSLKTLIHTHMGLGTILPISMGQTPYGMGNPWKPIHTALPVHHLISLQPHIARLSFLVYSLVHAPGQCV